jgi:hypothetical protein
MESINTLHKKGQQRFKLPLVDPMKLTSEQSHHDAARLCNLPPHPVIKEFVRNLVPLV